MWETITLSGFADEIDPGLNKQIEVLRKLDISQIEMRGVNGKGLVEHTVSEAKEIKRQLDAEGFRLSAIGSPIGKIGITDDFTFHMELYKHTVELAGIMETKNIRMFSFFIPQGEEAERYREPVMERLSQLVDYAAQNNIVLLHENEKGIYGDRAFRCEEIMKQFYGAHMKAVFDFANFVQCGEDTEEAYEKMKPYIAYVHIKDVLRSQDQVVPAGMGDGKVESILKKLKESGYEGVLSLEPHLADFTGFSALEIHAVKKEKMDGEEAFTMAYNALKRILERVG